LGNSTISVISASRGLLRNHETPGPASGRNQFNLHEKEGLTQSRKYAKSFPWELNCGPGSLFPTAGFHPFLESFAALREIVLSFRTWLQSIQVHNLHGTQRSQRLVVRKTRKTTGRLAGIQSAASCRSRFLEPAGSPKKSHSRRFFLPPDPVVAPVSWSFLREKRASFQYL
jgi:hypothetical protein